VNWHWIETLLKRRPIEAVEQAIGNGVLNQAWLITQAEESLTPALSTRHDRDAIFKESSQANGAALTCLPFPHFSLAGALCNR